MVPWSESTMTRLVEAAPEPLTSNMRVSTAMILDVVDRPGDPFVAMRRLLTGQPRAAQACSFSTSARRSASPARCCRPASWSGSTNRRARRCAPTDRPTVTCARLRLNQPLSTFALAAVDVLDPAIGNLCAGRRFGHRGDPRGPSPDPGGAAEQGQGRGCGRDEGREASSTTSGWSCWTTSPIPSRSTSCSSTPSRCTCRATRGPLTRSCRRSPSCARCGSERSRSGSSSASTG